MRGDFDKASEVRVGRTGLNKSVEFMFGRLDQTGVGKPLLEFINESGPIMKKG